MGGKFVHPVSKSGRVRAWLREKWQVLLFWLACALAGWYLGHKGIGLELYFRLAGINPEEWTPLVRMAAKNDPPVGSVISLDGLTDWDGRPVKLPLRDKMTGLFFTGECCNVEDLLRVLMDFQELRLLQNFQRQQVRKVQVFVVYLGKPTEEVKRAWQQMVENLGLLRDPTLAVYERLNVYYTPRFYLFDPNGQLRYLSPMTSYLWRPDEWQDALRRLSQELGGQ